MLTSRIGIIILTSSSSRALIFSFRRSSPRKQRAAATAYQHINGQRRNAATAHITQ